MQSEGCEAENLRWMDAYEKVVHRRHITSLKQAGIAGLIARHSVQFKPNSTVACASSPVDPLFFQTFGYSTPDYAADQSNMA